MGNKYIFNKKELAKLPFNYKYVELIDNSSKQKKETEFNPIRGFSIEALNEPLYICSHPEKPISKLFKPIPNNES